MLYPLSYGGSGQMYRLHSTGAHGPTEVKGGEPTPGSGVHPDPADDLSLGAGTRPPTEVGARALRFRRPARRSVARLRTYDPTQRSMQ